VISIAALTCDGPVSSICFFENRTASRFYPSTPVPTSIPNQRPPLGRSTKTQSATLDLTPWERTRLQPHETDQAGSGFNNDSMARVEADVSPVRRTISSATDVTYAASVKLLNFPSRLDRAPSKPACKSATPS